MSDKKKFKDSTVGKLLFGAASIINPTLGQVLNGVTSPKDAIAEITKAKISVDDKIKLQQLVYEQLDFLVLYVKLLFVLFKGFCLYMGCE